MPPESGASTPRPIRIPRLSLEYWIARLRGSAWINTRVFDKAGTVVATMLLNMATLKDSYAPYEKEYRRLYGDTAR